MGLHHIGYAKLSLPALLLCLIFGHLPAAEASGPSCEGLLAALNGPRAGHALFRLPHPDFLDGDEGPAYLHPGNTDWKTSPGSHAQAVPVEGNRLEGHVVFRGELQPGAEVPFMATAEKSTGFYGHYRQPGEVRDPNGGSGTLIDGFLQDRSDGIRFNARSSQSDLVYTLFLSFSSGTPALAAHFKAGPHGTSVFIPWSEFRVLTRQDAEKRDVAPHRLAFAVEAEHQARKVGDRSPFELRIDGSISFEADPSMAHSTTKDYLKSVRFIFPRNAGDTERGIKPDGRTLEIDRATIDRIVNNLFNPSHQAEALRFAARGNRAVFEELARLGFATTGFENKVTRPAFFLYSPLNYTDRMGNKAATYPDDRVHRPKVPIETGMFAVEHSDLAHALQVITMTRGMTPVELEEFKGLYGSIFAIWKDRWLAWDILFDSTGSTLPTSPLYWRDRLEQIPRKP